MTDWLVVKRGLYYMPNDCGYTGIKDYAGRYTEAEAADRAKSEGVSMIQFDKAPEFTTACFDDLARDHLTKQRDTARAALKAVEEWWLSEGMKHFTGAPYAIFAVRAALSGAPQQSEDASE